MSIDGLRCPSCFDIPACTYEWNKEDLDRVARDTAVERENPVVEFIRNGIFLPLGGVVDPSLVTDGRRIYAERETAEEILTSDELICRLAEKDGADAEINSYRIPEGGFRHASGPLYSYYPAYSDYLPVKELLHSLGMRLRKVPEDLTSLVWSVPFRGRHGTYCGYLHTVNDAGEREQLNIACRQSADFVMAASIHCWRLPCPSCAWDTCIRKAREVNERIMVFQQLQLSTERRLVHVVVSPPQDAALRLMRTKEGTDLLWKAAFEVLKLFHVDTGAVVLHPWREDSDRDDSGRSSPSYLWRAGPHFHCLGYGFVPEGEVAEFSRRTGWTVKVVHDDRDVTSPTATFAYLLSHAGLAYPVTADGVGRQCKAFRYFGGLSCGEVARIAEVNLQKPAVCPKCGGPLVYYDEGFKPVTSTKRTGIFCRRADRKEEKSGYALFCDDFRRHMDAFAEEGGSVREMDSYDRLWYFCRREKVEFLGKKEFFSSGDLGGSDGLPDIPDDPC